MLLKFFYKELGFFIEHDGVVLFDEVINFEEKTYLWQWGPSYDNCQICVHYGYAILTSPITD